jgi:hypothetical protein
LLTDVNGNPPQSGARNYVIVIRGFTPFWELNPYSASTAMDQLGSAIQNQVGNNASVLICRWSKNSGAIPIDAVRNAKMVSHNVVTKILSLGACDSVQPIGHSAGTWVANAVAQEFIGAGTSVSLTLLDAYIPGGQYTEDQLGSGVKNAEQYYETKSYLGVGIVLDNAVNFNVTKVRDLVPGNWGILWGDWHDWPVQWYARSVENQSDEYVYNVGFQDRFTNTGRHDGEPPYVLPPPQPHDDSITSDTPIHLPKDLLEPQLTSLTTEAAFTNLSIVAHGGSGTVSTNGSGVQFSTTNFVWATFNVNPTNDFNYATLDYSLSTNCNSVVGMWMDGNPMMLLQSSPQDDINDTERFPLSSALGMGNHLLTVSLESLDKTPISATLKGFDFDLAVSQPAITSQSISNGTFGFTWEAGAGLKYQPQYNTRLSSTNWMNLGGLLTTPTNAVMNAFDVINPNQQRYYKIQIIQ